MSLLWKYAISYETFSKCSVNKELSNVLLKIHINNVDFTGTFISVLNKHVPENKNTRANNAKFVNKILTERARMTWTRLGNKFLEETEELKELCNKQRNHCAGFFQKPKRDYFFDLIMWYSMTLRNFGN